VLSAADPGVLNSATGVALQGLFDDVGWDSFGVSQGADFKLLPTIDLGAGSDPGVGAGRSLNAATEGEFQPADPFGFGWSTYSEQELPDSSSLEMVSFQGSVESMVHLCPEEPWGGV
jgi:hypothetical protein